ncbi:MAG: LacI family transcriptional regulator, partial [Proteobacteria bacterium]
QALICAHPPTALICCSDAMALIALHNFHEMGIRVPRDISVIGFGNLLRTEYASPPLTTVAVPYEQMGAEAVKVLLEEEEKARFQNGSDTPLRKWQRLQTQLMVRRSTGEPLY